MSAEPPSPDESPRAERRRMFSLTLRVGETVAVLGLVLAAASFFVGRADRRAEVRAEREAKVAERQVRVEPLILRGSAEADGARVLLDAVDAGQVIQSQRYIFPREVREAAREIAAGRPQIEAGWIEDGLKRAGRGRDGEAHVPVAIVTTYIERGQPRTDRAIYRVGYTLRRGTLGRSRVVLQGVSRVKRADDGDLQTQADALWAADGG